jgi:replicative DNA helicase
LIIVAARPSMGKTSLCLTLAQNAAIQAQAVVGIFSLEMSKESLVMRMLSSEARVDAHRFRSGFLSRDEWARLAGALGTLAETKIFIDDTPGISVLEMRAKSRRLAAEQKKLDLIIVDYLQLMSGSSRRAESRQQEVSQISRELKGLAKELNVPLIALSQLSRAPESRTDHRPQLADLRESGAIEQDADVVAFIYREEQYNRTEENAGIAELIVAKQRNGPTGTAKLAFLKEFTRFENMWRE